MPFSSERTQLIKARLQEKLSSQSLDPWQRSFLTNIAQKFRKDGEKTQLTSAQYRKLHELLKIEAQSQKRSNQPKASQVRSNVVPKPRPLSSPPINPLRVVTAPRRAVRRMKRQLYGPILIVLLLFGAVSALLDAIPSPRTTATAPNIAPAVLYVSGNSVNQRAGPGTSHRVIGQLSKGDKVTLLDRQSGWSRISSRLGEGWMSSNYLSQGGTNVAAQSTASPRASSYAEFQPLRARDVRIIDGDTIAVPGLSANMRLVGFNTPETYRPKCQAEKELGDRATARLRQLVSSASSIQVRRVACACRPGTEGTSQCNFGRFCGTLLVDGRDVGKTLIGERLAVPFHCGRTSCPRTRGNWCQ